MGGGRGTTHGRRAVSLGKLLKFPKRKTPLERNQDELERALIERTLRYKELAHARQRWIDADNAVHELRMERLGLVNEELG